MQRFLRYDNKSSSNQIKKIDILDFIKIKILTRKDIIKGHYRESEKTAYRMGKNICKSCIWQGFNIRIKELLKLLKLNKTTQLKDEHNTWIYNSLKKIKMANKHIQRCSILLVKQRQNWDTTLYLLGSVLSK